MFEVGQGQEEGDLIAQGCEIMPFENKGWTSLVVLLLNFLTALSAILGVVAVLLIGHWAHDLQLILIPISFGMFMYIAGADLIPQLNKHNDDRKFSMLQVLIFLTGAGLMYFLSLVGGHSH